MNTNIDSQDKTAMTVCGPIPVTELGTTHMHEHVLANADFDGNDYNLRMDQVDVATSEMRHFKQAGGQTIVEQSCIGLGRDAAGLKRVSQETGVNIVACTGFYRECCYPAYIADETADQIADRLLRECNEGIDDTGVRPGILAEIATEYDVDKMSSQEVKVFTAIAKCQTQTKIPVSTHCWAGALALDQIDVLTRNGVPPHKILIGHLAVDQSVKEHVLRIAETGVYLGIDCVGYQYEQIVVMKDRARAQFVKELIDAGFLNQICISQDLIRKLLLKHYHGIGYDYLLLQFVPMLREAGVTKDQIETILVDNPRTIFS